MSLTRNGCLPISTTSPSGGIGLAGAAEQLETLLVVGEDGADLERADLVRQVGLLADEADVAVGPQHGGAAIGADGVNADGGAELDRRAAGGARVAGHQRIWDSSS